MKLGIHSGVCVTKPNFLLKTTIFEKIAKNDPIIAFFDFSKQNESLILAGNSIYYFIVRIQ